MWNLNGDDIKNAKEQLETRRVKLKADYEEELKRIDGELADIETVERVAVNFVSGRKGDNPASAGVAGTQKATAKDPAPSHRQAQLKRPAPNAESVGDATRQRAQPGRARRPQDPNR